MYFLSTDTQVGFYPDISWSGIWAKELDPSKRFFYITICNSFKMQINFWDKMILIDIVVFSNLSYLILLSDNEMLFSFKVLRVKFQN